MFRNIQRRTFFQVGAATAGALMFKPHVSLAEPAHGSDPVTSTDPGPADYTLRIGTGLVELAPD